ncbi:MAG: PTS system trehalose-specific EIIBC component [Lactococcus raffinolactis]|jgi:trehalose PTS system EIIBC or EIIBCA component|uniref:PTS system trehalose-specific EIIBC component n=1 Tax=Pseudolactococcus raffinolactis TaxID=1366 RepID=UPI001436C009|nr:PTS system trehalose-specific EIIBC component [Lactococcus raffinolactis]MBP6984058.1 PTS system trehalose-specific EIIBC component [Lactococcus sp.]MBW9298098.1 PTS trehalose transporter subunit IIBC [Lactococcus raffinolactis]MBW9330619.1 PTS trehalose transporter subunit IIBC [Lactococcus raffinolactis]MDG4962246.1 PTS system trehalose-specific EIIBC component [Lactococcus raffinolactis]MDN5415217.1 PTS system trehalose-specific EIIBC component [Lactococcus raffinolactis]
MGKFEKQAQELLDAIGGKENISAVTHCATRMRFVLNDDAKADKKRIENISTTKGMFTNAGQFQVIIGNDVATFYNDFSAVSGIEGVSKEAAKSAAKSNQNVIQKLVGTLSEIFTPLLPAIIVGGLILGFRNILEGVQIQALGQVVEDGVKKVTSEGVPVWNTITQVSPFWNGVNSFLWLPGEAIFHFLPVGIAWSVTRKMGTTQILGIVLGITLVSPQLLNAYAVNSTSAAEIAKNWSWDFGFFTMDKIGYQAQVIPAMAAGFLLAYLEKFFRKHIPEAVSMIFVPLFALIPTIIASHAIIGPIGWKIGQGISFVVNTGLTSSLSWLFGGIFGILYAPLVITGLHHTTLAIDAQLIADYGSTNLWPLIDLSNIAQGASVLAIYLLHKKNKKEAEISVPATISAWLGVTEPAMFGINLKYLYPFIAAMIGSGVAGMVSTLMGVRANAIGVGGLPGILAIRGEDMLKFILPMVIAIIVPIVLTFFFRQAGIFNKNDLVGAGDVNYTSDSATLEGAQNIAKTEISKGTLVNVTSPLAGEVRELATATDPVFSQGLMGQGVVIEPSEGLLTAPFDGVVSAFFPTKHAIGLISDAGTEILIHIGMDTVKLDGKGFEAFVQQGDQVKQGQKLLTFDIDLIKGQGLIVETPVIVTNQDIFQPDVVGQIPRYIKSGEQLLTATKI